MCAVTLWEARGAARPARRGTTAVGATGSSGGCGTARPLRNSPEGQAVPQLRKDYYAIVLRDRQCHSLERLFCNSPEGQAVPQLRKKFPPKNVYNNNIPI